MLALLDGQVLTPLGVREYEVFDLPYIFPDKAVLARVVNGPVGKKLLEKLEPKGICGSPSGTTASAMIA